MLLTRHPLPDSRFREKLFYFITLSEMALDGTPVASPSKHEEE
jgi:hypothetical protein